jgi:hypothetical protein
MTITVFVADEKLLPVAHPFRVRQKGLLQCLYRVSFVATGRHKYTVLAIHKFTIKEFVDSIGCPNDNVATKVLDPTLWTTVPTFEGIACHSILVVRPADDA